MPTSTTSITLTDYQGYSSGSYMAYVAPWNKGSNVQGVDYSESIQLTPALFPNSVVITSNWGSKSNGTVFGFNAIDFGDYSGTKVQTPIASAQIKNIGLLSETHSLTLAGATDGFNVIDDMFLTSGAGSTTTHVAEIEVFLHTPSLSAAFVQSLKQIGTFTGSGVTWTVAETTGSTPDILFMPSNKADVTSATIDIKAMLDFLTARHVLTGNEYFNGMALGSESLTGNGTTTVNNFSVDYQPASSSVVASPSAPVTASVSVAPAALPLVTAPVQSEIAVTPTSSVASVAAPVVATAPVLTGLLKNDTGVSSTDNITNDPTLTGHADANAVVTFMEGARTLGATVADAAGAWTFRPTGLADGQHSILGSETNAAGLTTRTNFGFNLDATPASITEGLKSAGVVRGAKRVTRRAIIGGSAPANAQLTIKEDGNIVGSVVAGANGAWSFAPDKVSAGVHSFTASMTDIAGNVSTASSSFGFAMGHARHG